MPEKIIVGPVSKGLKTNPLAFYIDNNAFPTLLNAYQWRGRLKRKRGTQFLNRLRRAFNSGATTILLDANGQANLLSGFSLQSSGNIVPGTVTITDTVSATVYTDPTLDGYLTPTGTSGPNTISYGSSLVTIPAAAGHTITAVFNYYPGLPIMGIRNVNLQALEFPTDLAFDTKYSYFLPTGAPFTTYDVSFYKNPLTGTYPGYVQKATDTPTSWNGQDYQQFYTVNYKGAFWATNGTNVPFDQPTANISMQYKPIVATTIIAGGPPAIVQLQINGHGLVVGDFLFINEVLTTTGINFQTGFVRTVVDANNVQVEFPNATIANNGMGGIAQYLTNRSDTTKDCIRWWDGDPTITNNGWVNFAPPLSLGVYPVGGEPQAQYYLVGCTAIVPFKGRLMFFGPVIQTSTPGSQIYLQDAVVFGNASTPYYTASFTGNILSATTIFNPILVPVNQIADASSYFEDINGYGGASRAGYAQPIMSVAPNEDVLIIGFSSRQARFVYTDNDLAPFSFYIINSELGTESTFSTIIFDKGILSIGNHGVTLTKQVGAERVDIDIPDQIFQFNLTNNGAQRVTAQRDFINEWVYFTYPDNEVSYNFPNQTLFYNYRDNTWALFNESYTAYGQIRLTSSGYTWATLPADLTWANWNTPWNSGSSTIEQPQVAAGNAQGFILVRTEDTGEGTSLTINNISFPVAITGATNANPAVLTATSQFVVGQQVLITGVVGMTQLNGNTYSVTAVTATTVTLNVNSTAFGAYISGGIANPLEPIYSPNHCLNNGDYVVITGGLGTAGTIFNNNIYVVSETTNNGFVPLGSSISPIPISGTYYGGGLITRMYVPLIQSKQFPPSWGMARKTRIGVQQYLFTTTPSGQITLNIYLSQDDSNAYNYGPIIPDLSSENNSLVYSNVLPTSPEYYIQACNNSSLGSIGNGATFTFTFNYQTLFGFTGALVQGSVLITAGTVATFTDTGLGTFNVTGTGASGTIVYSTGAVTIVFSVAPTAVLTKTNFQYYYPNIQSPTAESQNQIWHRLNTSLLGDTIQVGFTLSDAQMKDPNFNNQFAEIEFHSMVIEATPSQLLS